MMKLNFFVAGFLFLCLSTSLFAQLDYEREVVSVPKVDSGAVTVDGIMDEAEWATAAEVNLITSDGYNFYSNYYGRDLAEPDYEEYYARLMWTMDTLHIFIHIDEVVNDSSDLFWNGVWTGDQLFVSITNKLGIDYHDAGRYNGNVFETPEGPYYFLILGDQFTLNGGNAAWIPEEYRCDIADSFMVYDPYEFAKFATVIDQENGVWDIEMSVYNPSVAAQSKLGFNIGGSQGSSTYHEANYDAYAYYTWQANVPDDPFAEPPILEELRNQGLWGDPGTFNLATTQGHAVLEFEGDNEIYVRQEIQVPHVNHGDVNVDGVMDEEVWSNAAEVNLITSDGYNFYSNYYGRDLAEPDYEEYYARLLWSQDTLYAFIHIDEIVNDSSDLFWGGVWTGDQLFVSLTNKLGIDYHDAGRYNGNVFETPEGPFYFLILGDQFTLNGGNAAWIPEEYRCDPADSFMTYDPYEFAEFATVIDTENGIWDIELAIHNPSVTTQSALGFNLGGSQGSSSYHEANYDAYAYYTWQANVPDDPFAEPPFLEELRNQGLWGDPGTFNLATTQGHAVLSFVSDIGTSIGYDYIEGTMPVEFSLDQNYPNPFNPSTTIRFNVSKVTPITLKVYNTLGQEVAVLIDNQIMAKGSHIVTWNANNLASGTYFYNIEAEGMRITKKMVLIK